MPPFQQVSSSHFCHAGAAPVNCIGNVNWKRLGATTARPQNGRALKLTEQDHRVLLPIVCLWLRHSLPSSKLPLEATSVRTVLWELHEMGFHGRGATHKNKITMSNASVGWSGVKLAAIGLWSSGNVFSGVMNHASPSGSPMDKSWFGG